MSTNPIQASSTQPLDTEGSHGRAEPAARHGRALGHSLKRGKPVAFHDVQTVRLMTDHSGFPLWDEEGGTGIEHWSMLSSDVLADLEAWESYWSRHFHGGRGWRPSTQPWFVEEGQRLAARVQAELGDGWTVDLVLG